MRASLCLFGTALAGLVASCSGAKPAGYTPIPDPESTGTYSPVGGTTTGGSSNGGATGLGGATTFGTGGVSTAGTGGSALTGGFGGNTPFGTGGGTTTGGSGGAGGGSSMTYGTACNVADPTTVFPMGTVSIGSASIDAVASFASPGTFCAGFPGTTVAATILPKSGAIAYVNQVTSGTKAYFAIADAFEWTGAGWATVGDPTTNDQVIDVSLCEPEGANWLSADPDDGSLVYGCTSAIPPRYYDSKGNQLDLSNNKLLGMGNGGLRLIDGQNAIPAVLDAGGTQHSLLGMTFMTSAVLDVRAVSTGFLVAFTDDQGNPSVANVAASGMISNVKSYPPLPASATGTTKQGLDPMGILYTLVMNGGDTQIASRSTLLSGATIVLDDATLPMADATSMTMPNFNVHVGGALFLFHGP
jgi:hypothetical protein